MVQHGYTVILANIPCLLPLPVRICPWCSAKRAVIFAELLYDEVLEDVPTNYIVLTIPKRLRSYFKYKRSLSDILFKAACKSAEEHLSHVRTLPILVSAKTEHMVTLSLNY